MEDLERHFKYFIPSLEHMIWEGAARKKPLIDLVYALILALHIKCNPRGMSWRAPFQDQLCGVHKAAWEDAFMIFIRKVSILSGDQLHDAISVSDELMCPDKNWFDKEFIPIDVPGHQVKTVI